MQTHTRRRRGNLWHTKLVWFRSDDQNTYYNATHIPGKTDPEQLRERERAGASERARLYAFECGSFKIDALPNNSLSLESAADKRSVAPTPCNCRVVDKTKHDRK